MEQYLKHLEVFIYATERAYLKTENAEVRSELNTLNKVLHDIYNKLAPIQIDTENTDED